MIPAADAIARSLAGAAESTRRAILRRREYGEPEPTWWWAALLAQLDEEEARFARFIREHGLTLGAVRPIR